MPKHVILQIEDNRANTMLVSKVMDMFGNVELCNARTGEEGLRLAREIKPDLILLDINLPRMSGFDVLREVRADAAISNLPVVAMTASATQEELAAGLQAGFDTYLTKPFDLRQFLDVMDHHLGLSEEEDEG